MGNNKILKWLLITVAILVIVVGALSVAGVIGLKVFKKIKTSTEYQAVFLTNGQVYFGKLDNEDGWVVLRDIYYLQVTQNLQQAATGNANTSTDGTNTPPQQDQIQLVKLGSELHGPEDEMFIDKDKILFWENMKESSKVLQSIKQYKAQ